MAESTDLHVRVIVTTQDNERALPRLISALRDFENVLVVDSGSTDRTVALAVAAGWDVVHREYASQVDQLNWALDQTSNGWWSFIIDSDEIPLFSVHQLLAEARAAIAAGCDAIAFRRRNIVWRRWIRHGGFYPDLQVRLLRRDAELKYESTAVHSHVMVEPGRTFFSRLELEHQAFESVDDYWHKLLRYTSIEANLQYRLAQRSYRPRGGTMKTLSRIVPGRFALHLAYRYVFRLGFLDGWRGWHLALWSAVYQDVVQARRRFGA